MRNVCVWLVALATAVTWTATPAAAEDDARALVKDMLEATPAVAFQARATVYSPGGWERELTLLHKPLPNGEAATFMEVTDPQDVKDTRFLFLERAEGRDRQFMYVPSVKRAIEVMDDSRNQPFLGSDFYVSDLVAPDLEAYTYTFTGEEQVGGRACRLVELKPKDPTDEIYGHAVLAIDPADRLLVRTRFFDKKDALFKVWTLTKVEKIDGIWTPLRQEMENVQKKTTSAIALREVKYRVELPDNLFSREHLTR